MDMFETALLASDKVVNVRINKHIGYETIPQFWPRYSLGKPNKAENSVAS